MAAGSVDAGCGDSRSMARIPSSACTSWLVIPGPSAGSTVGCVGPTSARQPRPRMRSRRCGKPTNAPRRSGWRSPAEGVWVGPGRRWLRSPCSRVCARLRRLPGSASGTTGARQRCRGNDVGSALSTAVASRGSATQAPACCSRNTTLQALGGMLSCTVSPAAARVEDGSVTARTAPDTATSTLSAGPMLRRDRPQPASTGLAGVRCRWRPAPLGAGRRSGRTPGGTWLLGPSAGPVAMWPGPSLPG